METLERFQQNRKVIEDFTARTLAAIPSDYARLVYVASLRDLASDCYHHEGLETDYPQQAVQQALQHCHEELFARILETPLESQESDLRACLGGFEGNFRKVVARWQEFEFYRVLMPTGMPTYLQKLFCSNLHALLTLFVEGCSSLRPAA